MLPIGLIALAMKGRDAILKKMDNDHHLTF
jgi:hypothetical protein